MVLRIVLAVLLGGGIGLVVGLIGKSAGGQCPIACNPYVSTGLGVIIGLVLASRGGSVDAMPHSANLVQLETQARYEQTVSAPGQVVLVEFYTSQCPACRAQLPTLNALADRFAGKATVAVANAAALNAVATREGIEAVPTMLVFKDGKLVETLVGLRKEKELSALLDKHLGAPASASAGASPAARGSENG